MQSTAANKLANPPENFFVLPKPPLPVRSISVFFPCYNEEGNVERTTIAALKTCTRLFSDFEIIIVNDGSRDRTAEIAEGLARQHPQVRAVHNNPNRGYGGALQRGFREAKKDWVFYTDGDGQFDFEEMEKLLPLVEQYDIASAYRIDRQDAPMRKVNAFFWNTLVNFVFKLHIRDIDCAFKLYPRNLFDAIEMKSSGALIDTEVLARSKRLGCTIGQVGVNHFPRTAGSQTGAKLSTIFHAVRELFALRREILKSGNRHQPG